MKFRKPFSPKNEKDHAARYRAIRKRFHTGFSFAIAPLYGVKYIDAKRLISGILQRDAVFKMTRSKSRKRTTRSWRVIHESVLRTLSGRASASY